MKLQSSFYGNGHVTEIAQNALGKILCFQSARGLVKGRIVETEAYHESEKACHAYGGRKTQRTQLLFQSGGVAYIYLCYGVHHLFNVVTGEEGVGEAVLVRAVEPIEGITLMEENRMRSGVELTNGPGKFTQAMGIEKQWNGEDLTGDTLWLEDDQFPISRITKSKRIGVDYAGIDGALPWRYTLDQNPFISVSK